MGKKAVVNGRVIDGTGRAPIESGVVIVNEGLVSSVGHAGETTVPADADRIDAAGKTVMPCLIDGHMHVTRMTIPLDAHGHLAENLRAIGKLRHCLAWGTATVAHAAGFPENVFLRDAIDAGHVDRCARLLVGITVSATGGHVRGRAADGPWEVRKAVREMIVAGADFIKTAASGGFQWEHERLEGEDYTIEELKALTSEAHAKGKRVAVHAHAQPGLNHAIDAGCDIILHGALIDDEALAGIQEKRLHYMPTLYITSEQVINHPSRPAYMKERMKAAHPVHREGVRKAHSMGIPLSVGTDGGPGSVMTELTELVRCGLSPMTAIVAATRNTADALGILDTTGTLEPGKRADVLIVEGNPLDDISALADLENILLVMKDGEVQMAGQAFKQHLPGRA